LGWHREGGTKEKLSQLRMSLQEGNRLMPERKTTLALVKDEEDKRHAEFQNEMDSLKKLIKVQGQWHALFQYAMDSVKNTMKMENKCHTKFWDEMDSMMTMERECL
jgi:hypothetical protein